MQPKRNQARVGKLSSITKTSKLTSNTSGIDTQREATHFKNRILDLVDIFLKKQPSSAHTVRFILPLIELISGTSLDERQLSDKTRGIFRSRFAKSKEVPSGVDIEQVTTVAKSLHVRARKAHSSDILATFSLCNIFLGRILVHEKAGPVVLDMYRESLTDYMTRKNSALNTAYFQDFLRRFPALGWQLSEDLLDLSGRAVNAYRQSQAFRLLEILVAYCPIVVRYSSYLENEQLIEDLQQAESPEVVTVFLTSLSKRLLSTAIAACTETAAMNTAQMKDILKLGLVAVRQTQRLSLPQQKVQDIWRQKSWTVLRATLVASERFKSSPTLQKMCDQLIRTSQTPDSRAPLPNAGIATPKLLTFKRKAGDVEAAAVTKIMKRKRTRDS